jgi:hypothetical protein
MFIAKVFLFFFVCMLSACGNSISQTENTNQTKQNELALIMKRSGCWKFCPIYELTIQPDGKVLFEGIQDTKTKGNAEGVLDKEKLAQVTSEIEKADFFALKNSYTNVSDNCPKYGTDAPTVTLFIKLNGKEKTITHNLGCTETGENWKVFPQQLYNLENKIDEIAETKHWIGERKY